MKIKIYGYGIGIGALAGAALVTGGLMAAWFWGTAIVVSALAWADIERAKKGA